jgi:hypothetical protein
MNPMNAVNQRPIQFKPHVSIEVVDAVRAHGYLQRNTMNRPLSESIVAKYAEQMMAGKWMSNGDTITFAGDFLIDGQHRLAAIIKANVALEMIVVRNVSVDAFATKDNGKKRNGSDVLSILGHSHTKALASVLTRVSHYYLFQMDWRRNDFAVDYKEALILYPEAIEVVADGKLRTSFKFGSSVMAAKVICMRVHREQADAFFARLVDGIGLAEDSQERILREALLRIGTSGMARTSVDALAWIIKAWNAKRQGKKIAMVKWSPQRNEAFPKAI